VHIECLVDPLERQIDILARRLLARLLPGAGAKPVDAGVPGQLREPRPDRGVVAEGVEPLVRPGEHVLKDVLGVVLGQPEGADGDRVHIARETLHQLVPRLRLAGPAAPDELRVGDLDSHSGRSIQARLHPNGKKPTSSFV
jgi:hypothetical protein